MLLKLALAASTLFSIAAIDPQSPPAAPTSKPAASGRYDIDNLHTAVMFKVRHLGVSNSYGRFNQVSGSLILDADKPDEALLQLKIDAKSIDTNDETGVTDAQLDARDKHLRGPDFFNVEEFPTIEFESTTVTDQGAGKLQIVGDLTLHGVTKSVTASAEYIGTNTGVQFGTRVGYEAKFTLNRLDFEMNYMPELLGTEITVLVALEALSAALRRACDR